MVYLAAILMGLALTSLCVGIFITLRVFNIPDLTADGSFTLGAAITAILLNRHVHWALVMPFAGLGGFLGGCLTGLLYTKLSVNPLLSGILVSTGLYSVNLFLMGKSNVPLSSDVTALLTSRLDNASLAANGVTLVTWVLILCAVIIYILMSDYGIALRATGNNEYMARANGVNTGLAKLTGIALSNGFVALSGSLVTQWQGFADINMGVGIIVTGLGSVMMGEAIFSAMRLNALPLRIVSVVIGAVLFRLIIGLCLSLGADPVWLRGLTAFVVLAILGLSFLNKRLFKSLMGTAVK